MKYLSRVGVCVLLSGLLSLPMMAQGRGGEGGGRGTPGGAPSAPSASAGVGAVAPAPVVSLSSTSRSNSSVSSQPGVALHNTGRGGAAYIPNLQYTSFNSVNSYYQWQDFFFYLQTHYFMNSAYFTRFYRQSEPLVTPELLKLTVRQPLRLSLQLLEAVDSLETTLKDGEAGKPVDKAAVAAKTQEIRDLAKKIRTDEALTFFDQRRDKDALKLDNTESLGLDAIAQLREVATDLNTQLKNMYNENKTSTVSVQSLSAPSFESLTKGIDKLAKVIENSARRL